MNACNLHGKEKQLQMINIVTVCEGGEGLVVDLVRGVRVRGCIETWTQNKSKVMHPPRARLLPPVVVAPSFCCTQPWRCITLNLACMLPTTHGC